MDRHPPRWSLITNLSPKQASPLRLLALVRGHWGIENRSHSVRDVSFQEDRSRLCTGNAQEIMAAFRHLAITRLASLRHVPDFLSASLLFFSSSTGSCLTLFQMKPA